MIVHELRSPLAAMSNALRLWPVNAASSAEDTAREICARQLSKALQLIDDLLDVSRLSRGAQILQGEPVNLTYIVRSELQDATERLRARRQNLVVRIASERLWVHGERTRLAQLVGNLLDNSIKYSPVGGRIEVELAGEAAEAVLRVRDGGSGISSQDLPRIFEPFYRGSSSVSRLEEGYGLGLALVRRIVELHGGTIAARSDGENRGSEFTVRVPVHRTPQERLA